MLVLRYAVMRCNEELFCRSDEQSVTKKEKGALWSLQELLMFNVPVSIQPQIPYGKGLTDITAFLIRDMDSRS